MNILSNTDLEFLLQKKSFGMLTAEERYHVLESMTETEYERLRNLISRSKKVLKNAPAPSPAIRQHLLAAMRRQQVSQPQAPKRRQGLLVKMLRYRIPVWQAAAAISACIGLLFWLHEKPLSAFKSEKVYIYLTDTVYKEAALPAGMDTAVNVPPGRLNVKPVQPGDPNWKNSESIADSAARAAGQTGLPDTLHGIHLESEKSKEKSKDDLKNLWQF